MVTTRGGTATPGATATPRSSAKKRAGKRELESQDTPTQAKRLKKTSLKSNEEAAEEASPELVQQSVEDDSDTIHVVVPSTEGPAPEGDDSDTIHVVVPSTEGPAPEGDLPIRGRSSPPIVVAKVSPPAATASREHTATTPTRGSRRDGEGSTTPKAQVTEISMLTEKDDDVNTLEVTQTTTRFLSEVPSSTRESTHEPMPTSLEKQAEKTGEDSTVEVSQATTRTYDEIPSSTYDSEQAPIASQEYTGPSSQPVTDHVRFGSEEPTAPQNTIVPSPPRAPQDEPADDSASDSDEAPEVVTTATAARTANSIQQTALRASAAQAAAQEAKRQAREARLAEERLQKRLRDEKRAKKLARQLAKQQKATSPPADDDTPTIPTQTKDLPALLPDSLLATLSAQRPPTPPPQRRGKTDEERRAEKLQHHIKFLERAEKPAKDVKKGKLSVAVLGPQKSVLPPKVNRDTRNVREHWLKGRMVEKKKGGKKNHVFGKVERRDRGRGGFLRGED